MEKGEKTTMKLIPQGILEDAATPLGTMCAEDFSNDHYEGIQLRVNSKRDPVIIMKSRTTDPLSWKVVCGFSQVFFRTFEEAVAFCNSRGMRLLRKDG